MNEFWKAEATERLRTMEHWLDGYTDQLTGQKTRGFNESITDFPVYLEMFCYILMAFITPRKKFKTKEEPVNE